MKRTILSLGLMIAAIAGLKAQNINLKSIDENQRNIASLQLGYDFGFTAQLGYLRSLNTFMPILVGGDFSFPSGKNLMDDFKVRYGGQIEVFDIKGFAFSAKVMANFKRHQTSLIRMISFGSEFSAILGYYTTSWHIATEIGFDKSIATQLKHSDMMREVIYDDVKDGWYEGTSGSWFYGISGSKTFGESWDITFRLGLVDAEKDHQNPLLPFYAQLGANKRF
ncbi:MAG: hypothetical protein MI974_23885 [Chitinophagales bacterium]|nr:hypothetical protein [Chitinophagales bacterium]